MPEAAEKYLDLYSRFLDEQDAAKRAELTLQMQEIERDNMWNLH